MKKLTVLICALLLAILHLSISASADVIYEPFDSFYEQHRSECLYVGRSYTAVGPNGNITLYKSPNDAETEKTYPNGTALYVSYQYQDVDGILWACCDNWDDNITGWVPMEYLELIYDGQSFYEEHADQIIPVQISLDSAELTGKTVYFWEYPGSSDYIDVEMSADYRPSFQESYTDENGTEWIRCGYFMGIKGKWVNKNQPTADYDTLFPNRVDETEPVATVTASVEPVEPVDEIKPAPSGSIWILTVAVAAVAATAGMLLVILKKKE